MITVLHLAAQNPGIFIDHTAAHDDGMLTVVGFALGIMLAFVGFVTVAEPRVRRAGAIALTAGSLLVVGSLIGAVMVQNANDDAQAAGKAAVIAYDGVVANWIGTDYGISVTPGAARDLIAGESYVTEFDGKPTTISVVKTTDGHIAIVDENRAPLTPRH